MKSDFLPDKKLDQSTKIKIHKSRDDAYGDFLSILFEQLNNLKHINDEIEEDNNFIIDSKKNNISSGQSTSINTGKYLHFLEELENIQKTSSELPTQNKDISNISTQINEELKKFKTQLGRMAIEGGGGTNAVQYARGGFMDGDLIVNGNITTLSNFLEGENNLSEEILNLYTLIQTNSALWVAGSGGTGSQDQMKFAVDIEGDGTTTYFTYAHSLSTSDLVANVIDKNTNTIVLAAIQIDNTNISVEFADPFSSTYRLVAIGAGQPAVSLGTVVSDSAKWNSTSTTVKNFSASWGFNLIKIQSAGNYTQSDTYSHFIYDDDTAGSGINVSLLPINNHTGVKLHKKIGSTGTVTLTPPAGVLIDGAPVYVLNSQYQSVKLFTDGTNYFIE